MPHASVKVHTKAKLAKWVYLPHHVANIKINRRLGEYICYIRRLLNKEVVKFGKIHNPFAFRIPVWLYGKNLVILLKLVYNGILVLFVYVLGVKSDFVEKE